MGVACALAGRSAFHVSLPVSTSNARKKVSIAAATNTRPPAVTMGPPKLGDPDGAPGLAEPSGVFQRIFPALRSSATNAPHGGVTHGSRRGDISGSRYTAYGVFA